MRRVSPILLVLVLLIGLLIPAAAARGTRWEPHSDRVSRTRAYWTSERMKAARPMPIPTGRLGGDSGNWESARERPGYVPSVAPRTSSTTSTTSTAAEEVPLAEQQSRPLSTNGKVFLTDPVSGANYVCSGTALNAVNLSVVWTAGHCTYDGGYFTNWVFVPAYRDGSAPFGVWPAIELRAPLQWRATYNLRYDFGAAVVSVASDGSRLAQAVGGRGFLWNAPREQTFDAYGYPAAPPFSGGRMHGCHSDHAGSDAPPGLGPETMAIWCDMTGGSSGGGWIVGDALNSNISYGRTGAPGRLFGPYLGDTAAALYHESSESTAPGPLVSSPTPSPTPSATETEPTPSPSSTPVPTPEPVPSSSPSPSPTPTPSPSLSPSPEPDPEPTPESPVTEPPRPVILNVRAGPDPFSPDGDGRKDVARIRFRLTKLAAVRVVVKRHGVRVALPLDGEIRGTGRNVVRWDGRNTKGRRVRAGRYVFVIKATPLRADRDRARGDIRVRYR